MFATYFVFNNLIIEYFTVYNIYLYTIEEDRISLNIDENEINVAKGRTNQQDYY